MRGLKRRRRQHRHKFSKVSSLLDLPYKIIIGLTFASGVLPMGWLWLVGSIKLQDSFAKETYKRDAILQKRPIILSILLTVATPYATPPYQLFLSRLRGCCDNSLGNDGRATISRLLKIIGLFCKRAL